MMFERMRFIEMLYNNLLDKSKIKTSRRIVEVEQDAARVRVVLDDGTVESGDIVIGADGVHSSVRALMWKEVSKDRQKINSEDGESGKSPFHGSFRSANVFQV